MRLEFTVVEKVESTFVIDTEDFLGYEVWRKELEKWDEDANSNDPYDMKDFLMEVIVDADTLGVPDRDYWASQDGEEFEIMNIKEVI